MHMKNAEIRGLGSSQFLISNWIVSYSLNMIFQYDIPIWYYKLDIVRFKFNVSWICQLFSYCLNMVFQYDISIWLFNSDSVETNGCVIVICCLNVIPCYGYY